MDEDLPDQDLRGRVERLEREVEVLREALGRRSERAAGGPSAPAGKGAPSPHFEHAPVRSEPPSDPAKQPDPPPAGFSAREILENTEVWLPRVGIGLVLFAVAFAFKYSIDQGWVIPAVRVVAGYALGMTLLVLGFRLSETRPRYVEVLFGGAVATFYITGFAAFRLYGLVSYPLAFGLLVAATVLAFFLSLKKDRAALSVIGVTGGLGTPFLLDTGSDVPGLIIYTTLVLGGASAVYFHRGWRSLLWVSVVGGWSVIMTALVSVSGFRSTFLDKASVQVGIVFAWFLFWAIPLAREAVSESNPERWRPPKLSPAWQDRIAEVTGLGEATEEWLRRHVHLLSISAALITLALTSLTWPLSSVEAGLVALGLTGVYALTARMLIGRPGMRELGHTQGLVALMLSTVALALLLDGQVLLLTLAAQALVVHEIARRISDRWTEGWGHVLSIFVGIWLLFRMIGGLGPIGTPVFNAEAMTNLAALAALMGVSTLVVNGATAYRVLPQAGLALLLGRELSGSPLSSGSHLLLLAWTAQALGTHALAKRWSDVWTAKWGHVLSVIVAVYLLTRVFGDASGMPALNSGALADLGAIAAAVLACRVLGEEKIYYYLGAHAALLILIWREFVPLSGGHAYVSVLWAVYGMALLVVGLLSARQAMWQIGAATLVLLVGKLFVVDLANLEAIWRILAFMVVGGGFLLLGYVFPKLRKPDTEAEERPE